MMRFNYPSLWDQVLRRDRNLPSAGNKNVLHWARAAAVHLVLVLHKRFETPLNPFFLTSSSARFLFSSSSPLLGWFISYCHTTSLLCLRFAAVTGDWLQFNNLFYSPVYFPIIYKWMTFLELIHRKSTTNPSSFFQQTSFYMQETSWLIHMGLNKMRIIRLIRIRDSLLVLLTWFDLFK